ncbi:MAG TPA: hypothetical protein VMH49_04570 [Thermoplasmata archaeon]|nr:hypothetical protein [Thermoplasmata archaeon]
MSVPGPSTGLWGLALVLWGVQAVVVGEALRGTLARWLPLWGSGEVVERAVLDLYLGGASLYLVAAVELGAFTPVVVLALPLAAGAVLVVRVAALRRSGKTAPAVDRLLGGLRTVWPWVALASGLGLFGVELAAAGPVASGNTYDSSLLSTYVALLLQHGSLPLTFRPYGSSALLYPQGSTVWFGWAQIDFGLPPPRTALLVTPLFLGLPPLAGYVLGLRLVGSERVGAAFALALAFLGPSTRALAGGSNDFVLATPLVLLAVAWCGLWAKEALPSLRDAVAFGLVLGYAGALNVVGTQWMLPAIVVLGATGARAFGGRPIRWAARWLASAGAALLAGLPSVAVLLAARLHPSDLAAELSVPTSRPLGLTPAQVIGDLDPFLFRHSDVALSPIPLVRIELAVLLVVGVVVLIVAAIDDRRRSRWSLFGRWALAAGVSIGAWELLLAAASVPGSPTRELPFVTNAGELGISLFLVYGLVAAVPIALALDRLRTPSPAEPESARPAGVRERRVLLPLALVLVLVVPALVLTPASLGPVLGSYYHDFGNVTGADYAMLEHARTFLTPGMRVLVAPGSAGEFLPGYVRGITLVYPMAPGWSRANASYGLVVRALTNGTVDTGVLAALASLELEAIVVTGNNTVLWPAFWAAPLVAQTDHGTATFPVLWHEQDAWILGASACRPGSSACP